MKVLLLNQFFPPDIAPTGQLAADVATELATQGVVVTVLTSRGTYQGGRRQAARERWCGIDVHRVRATSLGRRSLLHRALDYASFYLAAAIAVLRLPRHDVVVVLSTPPLISAIGWLAKVAKGSSLVYWVHDLYPEVAVAFGALKPSSITARAMSAVSRFVFRRCDRIVVLGDAMRTRCIAAGASADTIEVIPNWIDENVVRPVEHGDNPLRAALARGASVLVMYSGNMGRGHDMETILGAAERLEGRSEIAFVFIGDGAKRVEVERAAAIRANVRLAGYASRDQLGASLSAGDLHLISMSPEVLGLLEPSKLYGVMSAGRPAVFVGPAAAEVARTVRDEGCGVVVANADVDGLARAIVRLADDEEARSAMGRAGRAALLARYSRATAVSRWARVLLSIAQSTGGHPPR